MQIKFLRVFGPDNLAFFVGDGGVESIAYDPKNQKAKITATMKTKDDQQLASVLNIDLSKALAFQTAQ